MKRTRSKQITLVVVTKRDLQILYSVLGRIADEHAAAGEGDAANNALHSPASAPIVEVKSANSMDTETDDNSIFEGDVLDLQKTFRITLSWSSRLLDKRISITLQETDGARSTENFFSVRGDNAGWVDSTFTEIERVIASMRPQFTWLHRHRWLARIGLAFSLGVSLNQLLLLLSLALMPTSILDGIRGPTWFLHLAKHPLYVDLVMYGLWIFTGFPWAAYLVNWLEGLWPAVEFDFGPEHLKHRKRIRGRLSVVGTLVVLPLVIEAVKRYALNW